MSAVVSEEGYMPNTADTAVSAAIHAAHARMAIRAITGIRQRRKHSRSLLKLFIAAAKHQMMVAFGIAVAARPPSLACPPNANSSRSCFRLSPNHMIDRNGSPILNEHGQQEIAAGQSLVASTPPAGGYLINATRQEILSESFREMLADYLMIAALRFGADPVKIDVRIR